MKFKRFFVVNITVKVCLKYLKLMCSGLQSNFDLIGKKVE